MNDELELELERMVDDLCDTHGDSRVIAVKGKIQELLEKAHKIGWNHATENCCGCLDFL